MATTPANTPPPKPQRVYQALCPSCGAPLRFLSAASTQAVCGYCKSTVAREGEALQKIGTQAELFDDHSPLQLFATGQWAPNVPEGGAPAGQGRASTFTLVGRLQYRYGQGVWNEWLAWFDDGRTAYLSEDNGSYVMSQPLQRALAGAMQQALGPVGKLQLGQTKTLQGTSYTVTSLQQATLIAAQGEFPTAPPPAGKTFLVAELRSPTGTVLSAEASSDPPGLYLGRAVGLEALRLKGLRDDAAQKDIQGRSFACPNCGSPVQPVLAETKSITCQSCNSLIDLSQGIGGELRHAVQDKPITPTIALGSTGTLQGKSWQVVGFQHRVGKEAGDDELFGWSEYLLYNRNTGFQFLVESTEGWSLVRPITGAPQGSGSGVRYNGRAYTLQYRYTAETEYVAGEFYWQVNQGESTQNADYANGQYLLSSEQGRSSTGGEVVWSSGSRLPFDLVARTFGLKGPGGVPQSRAARDTALPAFAAASISSFWWVLFWIIVILVVFAMLRSCDDTGSGSSYGGNGGGYGGYSSGGGHK